MFKEGQFPANKIKELNDRFRGEAYIMTSSADSHFMDTDSSIEMWENVYGPAIACRRTELEKPDARACLIFDGFRGNDSGAGHERREQFEESHNAGTSQLEANSSAHPQPCDAVHGHFRLLTDNYEDVAFGFNDDLLAW